MTPKVTDVRTPAEKALGEAQATYFGNLMGQQDFGYKDESAAQEPIYQRAQHRLEKAVSGAGAERGFGMLRQGPQLSAIARGTQEMAENRAADDIARRDAYKRWVFSQGREAATPTGGRSVSPSPFSQLIGPVLGATGAAFGGPLGAGIAGGFGGMMAPSGQGFSRGFGQGMDQYYSRGYSPYTR